VIAGVVHEALKAVCRGELTPEEADSIARVVLVHNRLIETADHERRLAALESKPGGQPERQFPLSKKRVSAMDDWPAQGDESNEAVRIRRPQIGSTCSLELRPPKPYE
jgi:hypothetical protein